MPAEDPRFIVPITDQYRQYGPWGIRVPSGGTQYFQTKEEAEKYMVEHPWKDEPCPNPTICAHGLHEWRKDGKWYPVPKPIPPTPPVCANCGKTLKQHTHWPGSDKYWCGSANDLREFMPVPPTSAPRSGGGLVSDDQQDAPSGEYESESMYLERVEAELEHSRMDYDGVVFELEQLRAALMQARERWTICPECDRPKSLLYNGPVEYVYVCEFCKMLEENERLAKALTQAREALEKYNASGRALQSTATHGFIAEVRAALAATHHLSDVGTVAGQGKKDVKD